jgi:hypothetical protein
MSYEPRVYGIGEASKYCSNCGAQNDESATRCSNCGNTLQRIETPTVDVPPPPEMAGGSAPAVPTRLVGAIVLTILNFVLAFFTFITGLGVITSIIAIVFAAQVNGKLNSGNYAGAVEASKVARILNWVSLGILAVGVLIIAILAIFTIFVLQQVALLLPHAHLRAMILAGKSCASVDVPLMGMVQLRCNPL